MKKIHIELQEGTFDMIADYASLRHISAEKAIEAIVEKFAPVTHSMLLEDIIRGYEESAAENLDWANL